MSDWFDDFIREAQRREVADEIIASVTAEIRAECAAQDTSPHTEYGDPVLYAQAVMETTPAIAPSPPQRRARELARILAAPLTGVIGWQLGSRSVGAALEGTGVEVTSGDLVWWVILLVATVGVVGVLTRILRHTILLTALGVALIGTALLAALYLQAEIAVIPLLFSGLGAVAFLAVSVIVWRRTAPLKPGSDEALAAVAPWTFPILTLLQAAMTWVLSLGA